MAILILKSNGTQGGATWEAVWGEGERGSKKTEGTEATVAETLGEGAPLNLFKFQFMKPHLSLTEVQIFIYFYFSFRVGLVSKANPSGFTQVPPFQVLLSRANLPLCS